MKLKNIRVLFVTAIAFTLLSTGCSITFTKNYYNAKPKQQKETDSTTCASKLDSQASKPNDGQK
ncbi:hypothetical protein Aeqsu_3168 [Aequorivita sublithincola DSM 14238]|uniref:Lipoprotein n=1 Tax=Aequorivita sublithincola (strain DSM 14238 / LMG 21431 / ACAM 643 / 9-3) TaxID=746697 RepID=I3Z034_AEQSU|nr:hypothetical protein [Aequorivita sublithincola]AFL82602.1 hypothetical protein Aeqsu_3168 [Aequorivita sublithincola DSM 14238]